MNTVVESVFLAAVATLPALAEINQRTGVSAEENPPDTAAIIVNCPDCEHTVGPLWKATIVFRLETPAYNYDRSDHDARFNALRAWLADKAAVTAAVQMNGMGLGGYFVQHSRTSIEDKRWVAEIEIVAGAVDTSAGA
jgi:hypothetical protein